MDGYHKMYYLISDVGAYVMDPHSLYIAPPYFTADVGAGLASQADLVNALPQSCAAELVQARVFVQGRLKKRLKFWEEKLQPSEFVLGIIHSGYTDSPLLGYLHLYACRITVLP